MVLSMGNVGTILSLENAAGKKNRARAPARVGSLEPLGNPRRCTWRTGYGPLFLPDFGNLFMRVFPLLIKKAP